MNELAGWVEAVVSGVAGMALGAFFFGGLWWTVKASVDAARPGLLVFVSLLVRMGITLAGFYLVAGGDWQGFAQAQAVGGKADVGQAARFEGDHGLPALIALDQQAHCPVLSFSSARKVS